LPWFRLRRRKDDQPAAPAAVPPADTPADVAPATETTEDEAPAADGEAPKRRRRRGSRGGRGRRKPGASSGDGAAEQAAAAETPPAKREPSTERSAAKKRSSGRERSDGRERRRQTQRRAPLPAAKRELVISVDVGEQRVALLEDGMVAAVYLERPERRSIAGNIYLGTVDNVLPGMEAAFVEIGLEKNGFLYVDEIVVPELEGKRHGKKITDLIQRGQHILVQAVKDPMKTKGARLTTEISLPGRFLVYVPNGEGLGVSRRLEDAERQRLKDILKEIAPAKGGVIVRTAAEGASAEDVERDLVFLERLWKTVEARAKTAQAPELVYQEAELPLRIVRDLFAGDFAAAHVDSERTYKRIVGYLKKTSPHMVDRVDRTKDKEPLFERYGVEKEIASTLDRRVDLPSGGYLIFDYAEAFTVIDVNTGRFVGSRSKSSTQRLEDTATKNNLEAVKEVVRQLRLRDIGGIIVIDQRHIVVVIQVVEADDLVTARKQPQRQCLPDETRAAGNKNLHRHNLSTPACSGNRYLTSKITFAGLQ
jgi:Rne/Rng family ribonuclease